MAGDCYVKSTQLCGKIRGPFFMIYFGNSIVDVRHSKAEPLGRRSPPKVNRSALAPDILDRTNPFARILDLAADAIIAVNVRKSIVFFNRSAEAAFGYSAEEVRAKPLKLLFCAGLAGFQPDRITTQGTSVENACGTPERREIMGRRKDGSQFPAKVSLSKIEFEGGTILSLTLQDVTSHAFTEERLRAALREKEVLLEEVHHRVKNNLQVITSLLRLQARSIKDAATRIKFDESRYRIQAMAILHEILDESSSLAEIDFANYIQRLVAHLVRSYGAIGRIQIQAQLEPLSCHRDIALPCGLIVNEVLSNAFKYAFPGGKEGEVRIELRRGADGMVRLLIADNGIGVARDWDWRTSPTLGLRLVRTLARQIEADLQFDGDAGTVFSITFRDGFSIGIR
jgi:two-component system, sensor histidine kinase PdtaS